MTALCIVGLSLVSETPEETASSEITEKTSKKIELPSLGMEEVLRTGIFYKIWFGFFAIMVTQVSVPTIKLSGGERSAAQERS